MFPPRCVAGGRRSLAGRPWRTGRSRSIRCSRSSPRRPSPGVPRPQRLPLPREEHRPCPPRRQRRRAAVGAGARRRGRTTTSERGLLGIAVNSESPPRVSSSTTPRWRPDGGGCRRQARRSATASIATRGTPARRSSRIRSSSSTCRCWPGPNHNGGVLTAGPPPTPVRRRRSATPPSYVVIGDLNRDGQLQNNAGGAAPDDTGVILRVQQDGSAAPRQSLRAVLQRDDDADLPERHRLSRPAETCRDGGGAVLRLRRSQRLRHGDRSGDRSICGHRERPGSYDEVNRVAPGMNSGWTPIMGPDARDPEGVGRSASRCRAAPAPTRDPEYSWLTPVAVTGIVFPAAARSAPRYDSVALVGDFNVGQPLSAAAQRRRAPAFDLSGVTRARATSSPTAPASAIWCGWARASAASATWNARRTDPIYIASVGGGADLPTARAESADRDADRHRDADTVRRQRHRAVSSAGTVPVPSVTVVATGAGEVSTSTAANGTYTASPLPAGEWTLTPHKTGGANLGISTLDATWVLQHYRRHSGRSARRRTSPATSAATAVAAPSTRP